jgi:hypothetical protein
MPMRIRGLSTKPFKLADGGGLHLLITPTGSRWWRLLFRVHGKEQKLSLGTSLRPGVSICRRDRPGRARSVG